MTFLEWLAGKNNPRLPKSEYLYGAKHLSVWIGVVVLSIIVSIILAKKSKTTKDKFFKIFALIFMVLDILDKVVYLIFLDKFDIESIVATVVPMYFCNVVIWLVIISLLTKKQSLINSGAIFGLLVTFAFFVSPYAGFSRKYMTFDALYSIVSHSLGLFLSIVMIATRYAKFDIKTIWQPFVIFAIFLSYGLTTSLLIFPGHDYFSILNNQLGIDFGIPWWSVYVIFVSEWKSVV